eukprot:SAG31_NODE_1834_length_7135_cov_6.903923_3_plen_35_part_00
MLLALPAQHHIQYSANDVTLVREERREKKGKKEG